MLRLKWANCSQAAHRKGPIIAHMGAPGDPLRARQNWPSGLCGQMTQKGQHLLRLFQEKQSCVLGIPQVVSVANVLALALNLCEPVWLCTPGYPSASQHQPPPEENM